MENRAFGFDDGETRSYAMNAGGRELGTGKTLGVSRHTNNTDYRRVMEVADPSSTFLLVEMRDLATDDLQLVMSGGQNGSGASCDSPYYQSDSNKVQAFHNKKWNYLFGDGHVQLLAPAETVGNASTSLLSSGNPKGMWSRIGGD
jgi:prepilin-type processing-associated H-X9-DG protein